MVDRCLPPAAGTPERGSVGMSCRNRLSKLRCAWAQAQKAPAFARKPAAKLRTNECDRLATLKNNVPAATRAYFRPTPPPGHPFGHGIPMRDFFWPAGCAFFFLVYFTLCGCTCVRGTSSERACMVVRRAQPIRGTFLRCDRLRLPSPDNMTSPKGRLVDGRLLADRRKKRRAEARGERREQERGEETGEERRREAARAADKTGHARRSIIW